MQHNQTLSFSYLYSRLKKVWLILLWLWYPFSNILIFCYSISYVFFPSVRKTLKVMCVRQMLSNRETKQTQWRLMTQICKQKARKETLINYNYLILKPVSLLSQCFCCIAIDSLHFFTPEMHSSWLMLFTIFKTHISGLLSVTWESINDIYSVPTNLLSCLAVKKCTPPSTPFCFRQWRHWHWEDYRVNQ